jgi:hypothetical protein
VTEVKIIGGRVVVNKTSVKRNGKPPKYPYPIAQYDALLKVAKSAGVDIGSSKTQTTKTVNAITHAVIDDFIAAQNKPKVEK